MICTLKQEWLHNRPIHPSPSSVEQIREKKKKGGKKTVLNRNCKQTANCRQKSLVAVATGNVMDTNIGKSLCSLSSSGSTCAETSITKWLLTFPWGILWLSVDYLFTYCFLTGRLYLKESSTWNISHTNILSKKRKKSSINLSTFIVFSHTHLHTYINKYLQRQDGGK